MKKHYILGIESSCDDTSAAVTTGREVIANVTANQDIHSQYGGVVPELASRAHQSHIVPVVSAALKQAGLSPSELNGIAFTASPGLLGSLLVGASFAKSLALALEKPLLPVNHMQAHILAHLIEDEENANPEFPFLCLTVSGGHTQIVRVESPRQFSLMGQTLDDAAGEAFDKAAKLMGLPYPGGPQIDKLAQQGNPERFQFSEPRMKGYNYSLSGLKTSFLYFLQEQQEKNPDFISQHLADLAASLQATIIRILMYQLERAVRDSGITQVALAGGVAANRGLREALRQRASSLDWHTYIPSFEYCTDNGAMIAISGYYLYQAGEWAELDTPVRARESVESLSSSLS